MRAIPGLLIAMTVVGCSNRVFTNLGNGTGVPAGTIASYARQHGVSDAQARRMLRHELDVQRVEEHARKYGISWAEAERQIDYSDARQATQKAP